LTNTAQPRGASSRPWKPGKQGLGLHALQIKVFSRPSKKLKVQTFICSHLHGTMRFTMQSGILTSISSRQCSAINGRPL